MLHKNNDTLGGTAAAPIVSSAVRHGGPNPREGANQDMRATKTRGRAPAAAQAETIVEPAVFEAAFESLPQAALIFDRRLEVVRRNLAARAMLPEGHDLVGLLTDGLVEGRVTDWASELRHVLQTLSPRAMDVALRPQDQRGELLLHLAVCPLRTPSSIEAAGGLLLAEDITEQIGLARRAAVTDRLAAVGKLAAKVAHELNNPLDGILRFTNLAMRRAGASNDERLIRYLRSVQSAVQRMSEITGDLLTFSHAAPDAGERATLHQVIRDAASTLEGRAREGRIDLVFDLRAPDDAVAYGSNLFQIFCNLIKNAVDAMPDGGTVTIAADTEASDVVISVADTGMGLPEHAERIFEPFFTTKAPGRGTGLGLAVCKELIEKYAGSITAAPNEPHGAVLTVRLPIEKCFAGTRRRRPPRRMAPDASEGSGDAGASSAE